MENIKIWGKIAKSGLAYHINIPKQIWEKLVEMGVRHKDVIVWDAVEDKGDRVEIRLVIYKSLSSEGVKQ